MCPTVATEVSGKGCANNARVLGRHKGADKRVILFHRRVSALVGLENSYLDT